MRTGTGLITIILHRGVRVGWGAWAHLEFKVRAKAFLQDNLQNFCRPDSSAPLIRCQEISLILISSVTKVDQAVWSKCSAAPVQMFHRPSHSILTRAPGGGYARTAPLSVKSLPAAVCLTFIRRPLMWAPGSPANRFYPPFGPQQRGTLWRSSVVARGHNDPKAKSIPSPVIGCCSAPPPKVSAGIEVY